MSLRHTATDTVAPPTTTAAATAASEKKNNAGQLRSPWLTTTKPFFHPFDVYGPDTMISITIGVWAILLVMSAGIGVGLLSRVG